MAVCTSRCRGCYYHKKFTGGCEGGMIYCDYICMEDKPRPCPAGDECTVRRVKNAPWKPAPIMVERKKAGRPRKELTEEEKAKLAEERRLKKNEYDRMRYHQNKEKNREKYKKYYRANKEKVKAAHDEWRNKNRDKVNAYAREFRKRQKEAKKNGITT